MCWARSRSRSGCCAVSTASPPAAGRRPRFAPRAPPADAPPSAPLELPTRRRDRQAEGAPQLERLAQQRRGEIRIPLEQRGVSATHQPVKELQIEFAVGDAQRVPMPLRDESAVPCRLRRPDTRLCKLRAAVGAASPHSRSGGHARASRWHGGAGPREKLLPALRQRHRPRAVTDLQRSQQAVAHFESMRTVPALRGRVALVACERR